MKKYILFLMALTIIFTMSFTSSAFALSPANVNIKLSENAVAYHLGDVNGDKKITLSDARLALRAAVKIEVLTAPQKAAADIYFDGNMTIVNARKIMRDALKIESLRSIPMLSAELEGRIHRDRGWHIIEYYGTYNESVVLVFDYVFLYVPAEFIQKIGEIEINQRFPGDICVWNDGKILSLNDAYEQGFLTSENIQSIADIQNSNGWWVR